jgi:hypothetical protein
MSEAQPPYFTPAKKLQPVALSGAVTVTIHLDPPLAQIISVLSSIGAQCHQSMYPRWSSGCRFDADPRDAASSFGSSPTNLWR